MTGTVTAMDTRADGHAIGSAVGEQVRPLTSARTCASERVSFESIASARAAASMRPNARCATSAGQERGQVRHAVDVVVDPHASLLKPPSAARSASAVEWRRLPEHPGPHPEPPRRQPRRCSARAASNRRGQARPRRAGSGPSSAAARAYCAIQVAVAEQPPTAAAAACGKRVGIGGGAAHRRLRRDCRRTARSAAAARDGELDPLDGPHHATHASTKTCRGVSRASSSTSAID